MGYKIGAEGELVEDPYEQNAIQRMVEMRSSGVALRKIANAMADQGHSISHEAVKRIVQIRGKAAAVPLRVRSAPAVAKNSQLEPRRHRPAPPFALQGDEMVPYEVVIGHPHFEATRRSKARHPDAEEVAVAEVELEFIPGGGAIGCHIRSALAQISGSPAEGEEHRIAHLVA